MLTGVVGRGAELELGRAFLRAAESAAAAMSVFGQAGLGKSTLWRAIVQAARDSGFQVLCAAPAAAETGLAFGVVRDLFERLDDELLAQLPGPQRTAIAVALLRAETTGEQIDHHAVAAGGLTLTRALAERGPVLIAIDDLHWADRESCRLLEFTARRLATERVGVLVSYRTGAVGADLPLLGTLPEPTTHLALAPLPADAITRIVLERVPDSAPHRLRAVEAMAGGNPFFALEIARDRSAAGSRAVPVSLRPLVNARLSALPARVRELLLICAAAGPCDLETVAAAANRTSTAAAGALESAERAELVRIGPSIEFTHPLYEAAVYEMATQERRRAAHRALAVVIDNSQLRARHLAAAAVEADPALADQLERAATSTRARGAGESAATLMEHAIRLTPCTARGARERRLLALGEIRFRTGDLAAARRVLEPLCEPAVGGSIRLHALATLAELRYHADDFRAAAALFDQLLIGCGDDARLRCHAHVHLAFIAVASLDLVVMGAHARAAARLLDRVEDRALGAQVLAVSVMADFMLGAGVDEQRLTRALDEEDIAAPGAIEMRPTLIAGCLRLFEGRVADAIRLLRVSRASSRDHGDEAAIPLVSSYLAWAYMWGGDLARARTMFGEAITTARRLGSPSGEAIALSFGSVVDAVSGDLDAAYANANRGHQLAEMTGYHDLHLWACWATTHASLHDGRHTEALASAEPILTLIESGGLTDPVLVMFTADLVEALLASGSLDRGQQIIEAFDTAALRTGRAWALVGAARCRAVLAATQRDLESAWHHIHTALVRCEGLELPLEVARTELTAGRIARRRRQRRVATTHLTRAAQTFDRAEAHSWLDTTRAELSRVAPQSHSPSSTPSASTPSVLTPPASTPSVLTPSVLTPSEHRIAHLAATGLTNRAVAARLQISPKTVEATLARTYAKLGIHSRAQLGAHFASHLQSPTTSA